MRDRLREWMQGIVANLKSKRWWIGAGAVIGWWLADRRWDLAGRANDALDRWAFPVLPALLRWIVDVTASPAGVFLLFVGALVGHAYWETRPSDSSTRGRGQPYHITTPIADYVDAHDVWILRLLVNNDGLTAAGFYARVMEVRGVSSSVPPPWTIPWVDITARVLRIPAGDASLLVVLTIQRALLSWHSGRGGHNGQIAPADRSGGFFRVRLFRESPSDHRDFWFNIRMDDQWWPVLVETDAPTE